MWHKANYIRLTLRLKSLSVPLTCRQRDSNVGTALISGPRLQLVVTWICSRQHTVLFLNIIPKIINSQNFCDSGRIFVSKGRDFTDERQIMVEVL